MAGVLPTRTSVELTTPEGKAVIPAATPRQAGVMTAEQVDQLDTLYRVHQTQGSGGTIVIERPSQPVDAVSRAEMARALTEMRRAMDTARTIVQPAPISLPSPDSGLSPRVATLEAEVVQLRTALDGLSQIVEHIIGNLAGLAEGQSFIERNALANVHIGEKAA